ncbi:type VII secretion integral membrane protein EccD [Corynebacterium phoceense]|uniref:type VII secretion integral membrane protein EccD n=1 Tax=Corynebacterium phoceense TaxID=1686286 RepID=UPI0018A99021|nr:type VII secretion integral membrane protein EccD [Corynebacterium phoceense]MBF9010170.1 type VII secretion integral membrane protein EccD [Corynebacterium phoceense]
MMTATSVRVTVRAHAGRFHKQIDVSLPVEASLDEVLGEVTDLLGAPLLSTPWRAVTPAGRALDHTVPLRETPLSDGALILLRPHTPTAAPVIRDAAEALAAVGTGAPARALAATWSVLGLLLAAALGTGALRLVLPLHLAGGTSCATAAACALVLHAWAPGARALGTASVAFAAVSAGLAVGTPRLGLLAAALAATTMVGLLHVLHRGTALLAGATLTGALLACVAGLGGLLPGMSGPRAALSLADAPGHASAAAALSLATCVAIILAGPSLATRAAGLRVPQLPTAGEEPTEDELGDILDPLADSRARRARELYEGALLACALACIPALGFLVRGVAAGLPGGWVAGLAAAMSGAFLLHAARHASARGTWLLMVGAAGGVIALCALAVIAVSAGFATGTWVLLIAAVLIAATAATACLWAPRVARLEPTTLVWFERAEALALTAIVPLALHIAGVFVLIRGLG